MFYTTFEGTAVLASGILLSSKTLLVKFQYWVPEGPRVEQTVSPPGGFWQTSLLAFRLTDLLLLPNPHLQFVTSF